MPKGSAPSSKRKLTSKPDRPCKQPKVSLQPVVGLMAEGAKTVTPTKHGTGKGFMKARIPNKRDLLPSSVTTPSSH